ncbi:uncharacterized protein LOC127842138 [Dreissena polymorpha]|uniref:Uncharacterized protein n=1 Tax=Dreissena polymorpha TaxID=45954 RepID=A0A9D4EQE3_DREPO|nr:uncharacterized protein LOC127842138 [Dreissena polymorpha]KAH3784929.1 hypothetical protein DPMN_163002 [Dreissena polymorpha]
MGNCCGNEEEADPLLGTRPVGARTGTLSQPVANTVEIQPQLVPQNRGTEPSYMSARLQKPSREHEFETSIKLISTVQLQKIPLPVLDKTFQDVGRLYNEVVGNFRSLETEIRKFKEFFVADTSGIPVLEECVKLLVQRIGKAKITIERKSKTFIEVTYDKQEVSRLCKGEPELSLLPLEHFSRACRHIRDILSHAPTVETNAKILLQDEETLRKEIMKSDLENAEMQLATKAFIDNVSKLRVVAAGTDTIKRDAEKKFNEVSKASKCFFGNK